MKHWLYVTAKHNQEFIFTETTCIASGQHDELLEFALKLNACNWVIKDDKGRKLHSSLPINNVINI